MAKPLRPKPEVTLSQTTTSADEINDLLTDAQLCKLCGVDSRTTLRWRTHGRGGPPYIRVGRQIRYSRRDVLDWLKKQTFDHRAAEKA